jgi:hypothetical protein
MKFYFAGVNYYNRVVLAVKLHVRHILMSVSDIVNTDGRMMQTREVGIQYAYKNGVELFLDSGAFTGNMTIEKYCDFVRKYDNYFHHIASLDVIGNAEESYINYEYMMSQGFNVIPTWHSNESLEWLDKYVSKTDYIAIGGIASAEYTKESRANFISKAIDRIRSKDRNTKIHLFGVSDFLILKMFGHLIESADSSTWLAGSRYGVLILDGCRATVDLATKIKHTHIKSDEFNMMQTIKMVNTLNEAIAR